MTWHQICSGESSECDGDDGQPPARRAFVMASIDEDLYVFGGQVGVFSASPPSLLGDLWRISPRNDNPVWTELCVAERFPPARDQASMVALPRSEGTSLLLFGGNTGGSTGGGLFENDAWAYDPDDNKWWELMPSGVDFPPGRDFHTSVAIGTDTHHATLWVSSLSLSQAD